MTHSRITLYYMPRTRAAGTRIILEELGAPYDLHLMNMQHGDNRREEYLAVNPLGKVPTIRHGDTVVTEQIAIAIYLGDLFPEKGLTPAFHDPARGTYLRWLVFYAACFEPALIDRSEGHTPAPVTRSVYGDYDTMLSALEGALSNGPYILGEKLSVVDLQWGVALNWTMKFGIVPPKPVFTDYVARITARPSFQKVWAEDEKLAEEQKAEG